MTKTLDVQHATSAERILSTALDLFAIRGYDATSVREICEAASITKPTLYHFFGSKEGVLQALVQGGFEEFRRLVQVALDTPGTFRDRVKVLARSVFESASSKPRLWRFIHSVIWAPPGTAPSQTEACTEFYDGVVGALAAAAEQAVSTGELAPGSIEARMLILMGSISEAATGHVIAGKPELTPELADAIVDTIFDGWQAVGDRRV
jgi:TetR/AcrR family transcriptional regulator